MKMTKQTNETRLDLFNVYIKTFHAAKKRQQKNCDYFKSKIISTFIQLMFYESAHCKETVFFFFSSHQQNDWNTLAGVERDAKFGFYLKKWNMQKQLISITSWPPFHVCDRPYQIIWMHTFTINMMMLLTLHQNHTKIRKPG